MLGVCIVIRGFSWWFWDDILDEPANFPVGISNAKNCHRKMQDDSENHHPRIARKMRVGRQIVRQISRIVDRTKNKPQCLQPNHENGKLPECHALPKALLLRRNNMTERLRRSAGKSIGAARRTTDRLVSTLKTTVYAFFHKTRSPLTITA